MNFKTLTTSILALLTIGSLPVMAQIDLGLATQSKESAQIYSGSNCLTGVNDGKQILECDRVVVTGADNPSTRLNFHFVTNDDNGIVYLADREPSQVKGMTVYRVVGFAFESGKNFDSIHRNLDFDRSYCAVNNENYKIMCFADDDDGSKYLSGLKY
jgi:hypothetical protein